MAVQRPTIKLVDISRSTPGKLFETEMFVHIYEAQKAKGKMNDWIEKSKIDKIEVTEVNDGLEESTVVVEEVIEETTEIVFDNDDLTESEDEDLDDYDLMNINELKKACKDADIHFTKKATENSLRNKLRA